MLKNHRSFVSSDVVEVANELHELGASTHRLVPLLLQLWRADDAAIHRFRHEGGVVHVENLFLLDVGRDGGQS